MGLPVARFPPSLDLVQDDRDPLCECRRAGSPTTSTLPAASLQHVSETHSLQITRLSDRSYFQFRLGPCFLHRLCMLADDWCNCEPRSHRIPLAALIRQRINSALATQILHILFQWAPHATPADPQPFRQNAPRKNKQPRYSYLRCHPDANSHRSTAPRSPQSTEKGDFAKF